jgi:hypothetical protein
LVINSRLEGPDAYDVSADVASDVAADVSADVAADVNADVASTVAADVSAEWHMFYYMPPVWSQMCRE